jgi:hypothetical protein
MSGCGCRAAGQHNIQMQGQRIAREHPHLFLGSATRQRGRADDERRGEVNACMHEHGCINDHGRGWGEGRGLYTVQLLLAPHWPRREDLQRGGPASASASAREVVVSCRCRCMHTKRINTGPVHAASVSHPPSMNLHTDEMERREAAVTSNNKKNALMEVKLNVMFPSLSHRQRTTTAYAHSAHCVLHRNGNKQQRGKARHVSPCAAARRCAQARQENEPFWQVAEVRRERERGRRELTLCLLPRGVALDGHARIDAAGGVGRCAATAAMDEGLLQLTEPEVGRRRGRRLEVPARAVAHT